MDNDIVVMCKSLLQDLIEVEYYSQKSHDISQISDFLEKSVKLSDTECSHTNEHSEEKEHLKFIKASTISTDSANNQQNSNDDINSKQDNISIEILTEPNNQSEFCTEPICKDGSIDIPNSSEEKEKSIVSFNPYEKNNNTDDLQIEKSIDMVFCSLCDIFIHKIHMKSHISSMTHISVLSILKIINQRVIGIINLKEKRYIKPLQLNGRKLNRTKLPNKIEKTAKYTCDQCDKIIKEDIINHEVTVHKSNIIFFMKHIYPSSKIKNIDNSYYPIFKCSFCNEIIHGILLLQIHFFKYEHKKNIKLLTEIERKKYNFENIQSYFKPFEFVSVVFFEKNGETVQPMEQSMIYIKNHNITFHKDSSPNSVLKFTYICFICKCTFSESQDIIGHLSEKKNYFKHFQNILFTYKNIYNISEELSTNKTQVIKSISCKDISISEQKLEEHNVNKVQINTDSAIPGAVVAVNTDSKNNILYQNEESNSGLFMSVDIFMEINKLIEKLSVNVPLSICQDTDTYEYNTKSVVNYYSKIYRKKFLDFEEIMFICNKKELENIKFNLQFYIPSFNKDMFCLVCNDKHSYNIRALYKHIHHQQHLAQLTKLRNRCEEFKLLTELIKLEPTSNKYWQFIQCYACNVILNWIQNRDASKIKDSKHHIYFPSHKENRKKMLKWVEYILEEFKTLWYNIEYFTCTTCKIRFERKVDFIEHLNNTHETVLWQSTKDNQKFNFCLICASLWYNDKYFITYEKHCQEKMHQYLEEKEDFAVTLLPVSLKNLLKNMDEIIADLFEQSNNVLNDLKSAQLRDDLKHTFETYQLPVEVCLFGSRVIGLALPNSDFDVYLNFGDDTKANLITDRCKQIQDCLHADYKNWKIDLISSHSRIPIIKVKHRLTGLYCIISFTNGLLVENSKLIKSFNTAYPPCQKLILFLKKWMSVGSLSDFKGITSSALTWLVIFYLQVRYKIPSIAALIKSHNQSKIISGWETGVGDTISINMPELSIHELLLGFFEYYGSFDYMHCVVCPLLGETCRKEFFTKVTWKKISAYPDAMALYITQLRSAKEYFRVDSSMCVQDPFELAHNLTKTVSVLTLKRFKEYCNESLLELCKLQLSQKKR